MLPLQNYLHNAWQPLSDHGTTLRDPIDGSALAHTGGAATGLAEAYAFAREHGSQGLQAMSYAQRAAMLGQVLQVLQANREVYYDIALRNCGTTKNDSAVDIEGAGFTLGYYAKLGAGLPNTLPNTLLDGEAAMLAKDQSFQSQHILTPVRGLALLINAYNFPAWGLWEKAAPALLSGVPVVIKPATVSAWLTHRMVADVIAAGILPPGALSMVCGSAAGLLDHLQPFDVMSFTGSADTAAMLRAHPALARYSVRANIEADSLNCAILGPDATPGSAVFDAYVSEVVREMSTKSGQRCTAIRRALVPDACYDAVAAAISAKLLNISVGNPRNDSVRMGALIGRAQYEHVNAGIATLRGEAALLYDGSKQALIDADADVAACAAPVLLGVRDAAQATLAHDHEVFGPVATLLGYRTGAQAIALAHRGLGSLVASVFSDDAAWMCDAARQLAASHGRVHLVTPEVIKTQTGHGNVMPASIHGGPGRAGGGEELGGLRGLGFYHRRSAIQGAGSVLQGLNAR